MVNTTAWFFSTLAQATASIVAFIIAIGTVIYSLERQRRDRQTAEFHKDLLSFKNKYESVLRGCAAMFHSTDVDRSKEYITNSELSNEELKKKIENDDDQPLKKSALLHSHVRNLIGMITQISPDDDLPSQQWVNKFMAEIGWFRSFMIRTAADRNEELYSEITGTPVNEVGGFQHYFQDIFTTGPVPEIVADVTDELPQRVTGKNLYTLEAVSESMFIDFAVFHQRVEGTTIGYNPDIKPVLKLSGYLVIVGVFFPIASLIFLPSQYLIFQIDGLLIVILQIAPLLFTVFISITLFELLLQGIHPRTDMTEIDGLTWVSRYTLRALPWIRV